MKNPLLFFAVVALVICSSVPLFAQIPDAGFETWNVGVPTGWVTDNIPLFPTVGPSSSAHSGSFAAKGTVVAIQGTSVPMPPILVTQPAFPWKTRSASLTGYYQFFPQSSQDSLFIIVIFYGGGSGVSGIAAGGIALGSSSSYKQFTAPIFYGVPTAPDSAQISIVIAQSNPNNHTAVASVGSYFLIDDLAFAGIAQTTAVNDQSSSIPEVFELQQNYPNPFNPSTRIRFSVAQPGHVSLKVYNVLGVEVASLVNEQKEAGTFSVNWNAVGLPSGIYYYRMSVHSEQGTLFGDVKRLVLLK
jgi:hypothetical protein